MGREPFAGCDCRLECVPLCLGLALLGCSETTKGAPAFPTPDAAAQADASVDGSVADGQADSSTPDVGVVGQPITAITISGGAASSTAASMADPLQAVGKALGTAFRVQELQDLSSQGSNLEFDVGGEPEAAYCEPAVRRVDGTPGIRVVDFNVCQCKGNAYGLRGVLLVTKTAGGVVVTLPDASDVSSMPTALQQYSFPTTEKSQWDPACTQSGDPAGLAPGQYPTGDLRNDWRTLAVEQYRLAGSLKLVRGDKLTFSVQSSKADGSVENAPGLVVDYLGPTAPSIVGVRDGGVGPECADAEKGCETVAVPLSYVEGTVKITTGKLMLTHLGAMDAVTPDFDIGFAFSSEFSGQAHAYTADRFAPPPSGWPTAVAPNLAAYCQAFQAPSMMEPPPACPTAEQLSNRAHIQTTVQKVGVDANMSEHVTREDLATGCICPNQGGSVSLSVHKLQLAVSNPPVQIPGYEDLQLYGTFPVTVDLGLKVNFESNSCAENLGGTPSPWVQSTGADLVAASAAISDVFCASDWTLKAVCSTYATAPTEDQVNLAKGLKSLRDDSYYTYVIGRCASSPTNAGCVLTAQVNAVQSMNQYLACNPPCRDGQHPPSNYDCSPTGYAFGSCDMLCPPDNKPTAKLCNSILNECVECTKDAQCANPDKPLCDVFRGVCVQCWSEADCCQGDASGCTKACIAGQCQGKSGCQTSGCVPTKVCNSSSGECVDCLSSKDCVNSIHGNVCSNNQCVECSPEDQRACQSGEICTQNECTAPNCSPPCSGTKPVCDGSGSSPQCVECLPGPAVADSNGPTPSALCLASYGVCVGTSCVRCSSNPTCAVTYPATANAEARPYCLSATGICAQCDATHACASATHPVCDQTTGSCRMCASNLECQAVKVGSKCQSDGSCS